MRFTVGRDSLQKNVKLTKLIPDERKPAFYIAPVRKLCGEEKQRRRREMMRRKKREEALEKKLGFKIRRLKARVRR